MKHVFLLAMVAAFGSAYGAVYDLNSDWSDSANPNGVWSYRQGTSLLPHVDDWQHTFGGWNTPQPGWSESEDGNNRLPFIFKSNGSENFVHDFLAGDVLMHSTDGANGVGNGRGNIAWTSPADGVVNVTGSTWIGRDLGRTVDWAVLLNTTDLTGGVVSSGDAYDRANPFGFADGSGGSGALTGISVSAGDQIIFETNTENQYGDFVGINFTVEYQAVPEPVSMSVLGLGALALVRRRRTR